MVKDDLKTGMWVKTRDGEVLVVMKGADDGYILVGEDEWMPLNDLDHNMVCSESEECTIDKVFYHEGKPWLYQSFNDAPLIWSRNSFIEEVQKEIDDAKNRLNEAQIKLDKLKNNE